MRSKLDTYGGPVFGAGDERQRGEGGSGIANGSWRGSRRKKMSIPCPGCASSSAGWRIGGGSAARREKVWTMDDELVEAFLSYEDQIRWVSN